MSIEERETRSEEKRLVERIEFLKSRRDDVATTHYIVPEAISAGAPEMADILEERSEEDSQCHST
ncbi:hypothetical protein [Acidithiobacillus ferridurans]|uniref:hypothetical protein n=1 Tax=Acidithiobacillus ferridurans TaxID=1232575 RepID=UPI0011BF29E5|nr:hypothetical protein [Acidithiobacillus ferridurans]